MDGKSVYYYRSDHGHSVEMHNDGSVYRCWLESDGKWMGEHIVYPQAEVNDFDFTKYM